MLFSSTYWLPGAYFILLNVLFVWFFLLFEKSHTSWGIELNFLIFKQGGGVVSRLLSSDGLF